MGYIFLLTNKNRNVLPGFHLSGFNLQQWYWID